MSAMIGTACMALLSGLKSCVAQLLAPKAKMEVVVGDLTCRLHQHAWVLNLVPRYFLKLQDFGF